MKVLALLLGHLVDTQQQQQQQPVYVYRVPDNLLLYYKISDIAALFHHDLAQHPILLNILQHTPSSPFYFRDGAHNLYVSTRILLDIALSLNKYLLAELCKLKDTDYAAGFAESILKNVRPFVRAEIGDWIPMELSTATAAASTSNSSSSNNNNNNHINGSPSHHHYQQQQQQQQNDTPIPAASDSTNAQSSPKLAPIKVEPQSPTLNSLSIPSANTRRRSESSENNPSKRQRTSRADSGGGQPPAAAPHLPATGNALATATTTRDSGLPKPVHTVGSQVKISSTMTTSALLAKRLASRQGKRAAPNLTIYPASYAEQSTLGVRSAPLNSNFFNQHTQPQLSQNGQQAGPPHHHHQQYPPQQQTRQHHHQLAGGRGAPEAPRTGLLMPGHHNLAPLLSPRAPLNISNNSSNRDGRGSKHHQEFAIPPIVPSQQQPPLSAHNPPTSSYHAYMASPNVYAMPPPPLTAAAAAAATSSSLHAAAGPKAASLPTTAAAVPLPPQTPTFGSLQKQQFIQPFEHLFETIETTRTLKTTLDDQIRRSSTLMQTLQASSTTIEGLVRNQIKEAQRDLEATLDDIVRRIENLERSYGKRKSDTPPGSSSSVSSTNAVPPPPPPPPGASAAAKTDLRSPPTIVRSQNEIGLKECQDLLHALRERLDRLERQRSS